MTEEKQECEVWKEGINIGISKIMSMEFYTEENCPECKESDKESGLRCDYHYIYHKGKKEGIRIGLEKAIEIAENFDCTFWKNANTIDEEKSGAIEEGMENLKGELKSALSDSDKK